LFDTNIKEVAELNYGDEADKTYKDYIVIMDDDVSKINAVKGFAYALQRMKDGEEAVTFFSSDYGYGITTEKNIQPYSMLRFDMKVTIGRKKTE
jgi:FKBP-type peptidyl-prolyl cis-trans isomerase